MPGRRRRIANSKPEDNINKEQTSKLWKMPPYQGSEVVKSEAGIPATTTSPMHPQFQHHGPQPAFGYTPTPGLVFVQTRTKGLLTYDLQEHVVFPSDEALRNRMESMFPMVNRRLNGYDRETPKNREAWNKHVDKVWSTVTSVMAELEAKKRARPFLYLNVNLDSTFGKRLNFQMRLLQSNKMFPGKISALPMGAQQETSQAQDKPSHEDVLAYKILSHRFCYEGWMVSTLVDTDEEYKMYPMAPTQSAPIMEEQLATERKKMEAEIQAKEVALTAEMEAKLEAKQTALKAELEAEMKAKQKVKEAGIEAEIGGRVKTIGIALEEEMEAKLKAKKTKLTAEMEAKLREKETSLRADLEAEMEQTNSEATEKRRRILQDAAQRLSAAKKKDVLLHAMMQHFEQTTKDTAAKMTALNGQALSNSTSIESFRAWEKTTREGAAEPEETKKTGDNQRSRKKRRRNKE